MATNHILLVEDNCPDARLYIDIVRDSQINLTIHVATDGLDAMDFLLQRGKHVEAPRPSLILLDLNLPKKDGRQVLKEVKEHPRLKQIPVLIQTSSVAEEDIFASYDNYASGFLVKPMSLEELALQLRRIEEFWFQQLRLPKERQPDPVRKLRFEDFNKLENHERTGTH